MPFFLRSVSYPRFVLFRYAAIPPSAAPVRFPLEITPSSSRKGIAEDSAPFSPGRSFTFQRAIVKPYKPMTEKSSICRLTPARKSCKMNLEYRHIYRSPSGSHLLELEAGVFQHSRPRQKEGRQPTQPARRRGSFVCCASIITPKLDLVKPHRSKIGVSTIPTKQRHFCGGFYG